MTATPDPGEARWIASLALFQAAHPIPVTDAAIESPAQALQSLVDARATAPVEYADYLREAVAAYEAGLYRAAILMVWAATVEHLYGVVKRRGGGVQAVEAANRARYGTSRKYREVKKVDDLLYLSESEFLQLGEDAGMFNRNARQVLAERLNLRNRCGHPTGYTPGREETVVFIESLTLNILTGSWLNW
ncbi:hypothetical protein [Kribbella soli]|uniref:DUF4145 domain-containing protein n=1 Tax=Kribbella soli TaxID=1124743 RepID=A0A4R0HDX8_9ACTN|nr:hypothetical protein [Kribbella soli]TCC08228.1 hypothetical protein E0H45_20195 [Kribbella soli]